jgi:hypothetical protein
MELLEGRIHGSTQQGKVVTYFPRFAGTQRLPQLHGAADGKHVRIVKSLHSGSLYYSYKSYFSIQLLAICDANYCFIYVDIGDFGKK